MGYCSCGTQTAVEEEGRSPAASSLHRLRDREQERCWWCSQAAEVRLVISFLWEDLEMIFGSVLGLSGLRQVPTEHSFDEAANAPWCGASPVQATTCKKPMP